METVFIWDTIGMESIQFFVMDGDYSHLNDVYINAVGNPEDMTDQEELHNLVYNENGYTKPDLMLDNFPCEAVANGAIVIVCGFLP